MNRMIICFLSLALLTTACNNEEKAEETTNPDLLSTTIVNNPRSATGTDTAALAALPTMDFKDTVYNFGTIRDGEVITHDFEFTNNGQNPLIVSNASAACGCTVADYPKEPVMPGKTGIIKAQFNSAGKPGHQEKTVTLTTNTARGYAMLTLRGEVKEKK